MVDRERHSVRGCRHLIPLRHRGYLCDALTGDDVAAVAMPHRLIRVTLTDEARLPRTRAALDALVMQVDRHLAAQDTAAG